MTRLKVRAYFILHEGATPTVHSAIKGSATQLFPVGQEVHVIGPDARSETSLVQIPGTGFYHWMPTDDLEEIA